MKEETLRKSAVSAGLVMGCTIISRLLGFIRMAVINAVFGADGRADVLNAVFNIPNNMRKLLAEGALSSAFIPVLSSSISKEENRGEPLQIVRNILTVQLIILVPILVLSVIFARPVSRIFLDFTDESRLLLGYRLFRYLIHYLLLISISAVLMGVLNSHNIFFIPAFTPILFSISVIASILLFYKTLGIFSMAVGVLAGGAAQILFQAPKFTRLGYDFKLNFNFSNKAFRRIMKHWLPVVATSSIFTVNQIIAMRFATALDDGSASALQNALVFWQLPFGIFSTSIVTVLFPRMSRQVSTEDTSGLRRTVSYGLRSLILLLVPSALIMMLLGNEIIAVAFQRGEFVLRNTIMTADVLFGYSIGLFSVAAFNFLQRFFYAAGNYKIPLITALVVLIIDVSLSLWLKETYLRVTGLAVANSIAFTAGLIILFYSTYRKLQFLFLRNIAITSMKTLIALLPLTAFLLLFKHLSGNWWQSGSSFKGFILIFTAGVISFLLLVLVYAAAQEDIVSQFIKRKIREDKNEKT